MGGLIFGNDFTISLLMHHQLICNPNRGDYCIGDLEDCFCQ
jgi:hypothetical protein